MWYKLSKVKKTPSKHSGVMIAFHLTPAKARDLALSDKMLPKGCSPELPEELHLTLAYLGKAAEIEDQKEKILKTLEAFAASHGPMTGEVSGVGRFNNGGKEGENALYASFDSPELLDFRQALVAKLKAAKVKISENHAFTPHITIAYLDSADPTPPVKMDPLKLTFGRIALSWAGKKHFFSLDAD